MSVWLSAWEWSCCGEPFETGSEVTLGVSADVGEWFVKTLGEVLASSLDGVEMHHENDPLPQVTGVVTGITAVWLRGEDDSRITDSVALEPIPRVPWREEGRRPAGYLVALDVSR
jgi:hypothetical protein